MSLVKVSNTSSEEITYFEQAVETLEREQMKELQFNKFTQIKLTSELAANFTGKVCLK